MPLNPDGSPGPVGAKRPSEDEGPMVRSCEDAVLTCLRHVPVRKRTRLERPRVTADGYERCVRRLGHGKICGLHSLLPCLRGARDLNPPLDPPRRISPGPGGLEALAEVVELAGQLSTVVKGSRPTTGEATPLPPHPVQALGSQAVDPEVGLPCSPSSCWCATVPNP